MVNRVSSYFPKGAHSAIQTKLKIIWKQVNVLKYYASVEQMLALFPLKAHFGLHNTLMILSSLEI